MKYPEWILLVDNPEKKKWKRYQGIWGCSRFAEVYERFYTFSVLDKGRYQQKYELHENFSKDGKILAIGPEDLVKIECPYQWSLTPGTFADYAWIEDLVKKCGLDLLKFKTRKDLHKEVIKRGFPQIGDFMGGRGPSDNHFIDVETDQYIRIFDLWEDDKYVRSSLKPLMKRDMYI